MNVGKFMSAGRLQFETYTAVTRDYYAMICL